MTKINSAIQTARKARELAKHVALTVQHPAVKAMFEAERNLSMAERMLLNRLEKPWTPADSM